MNITIFGLGAIGSNLLLNLSTQYPDSNFMGIDFDTVEQRNIGIQQYFVNHIGRPKANTMGVILNLRNKGVSYIPVNRKIESITALNDYIDGTNLVLDCFDNSESRQIIKDYCIETPCLHIGFSPTYTAEIIWNEDYSVPGDLDPANDDICTLTDAASFIQFVVGMAGMTINDFIDKGEKNNYIITNKFQISKI
jgi:molybdopterin/thiamine biosynthesis adenylyltransferase